MTVPPSAEPSRPWLLVIVLTAVYAYAFVDRVVLALLVEPIKGDLHVSDFEVSLLLGLAFAAFYALLNLPAGFLVDRVSRRALIGVASVGWAGMTVCCGLAQTFNEMFLARAGVGLAEAVIAPAAFSLIRDALPQKSRGTAFSLYAMAPMIGGAIALAGGGLLLRAANQGLLHGLGPLSGLSPWRVVLVLIGLFGAPISLLLLLCQEPARALETPAAASGGRMAEVLGAVRESLGVYVALVAYISFGAMMSFGQSAWLPAMLGRRWLIAPDRIGPILGAIALLCGLGGLSLSGYVLNAMTLKRRDIRLFGVAAAAATAVGLAGAALAPSFPIAIAMAAFGLFFVGVSFPVGATTLSDVAPAPLMGKLTGGYLMLQTLLGQAGGPLLIALSAERLFHGRMGLSYGFALMMGLFGAASALSALALSRALGRTNPGRKVN